MHIPHGDPLLVHLMMFHEVRCQHVFEMGRFLFDIHGTHLDFGETEYILICGLKVVPYVDLLHDEKGRSYSNLRSRLFPDIYDVRLRLKDLEDLIMSPNYLALQDEDDVMLIQLVFMLKGLHRRDVKTDIPAAVYKLADNKDDWNRFALGTYLWTYTSCLMREMFKKIEEFRIFKQANPESKKPNNQPINVMAIPEELMLLFYVRYVNWTLNPVESPPRQHSPVQNSPLVIVSPARRKMYKSEIETSLTESDTNASSLQHLEIETMYMLDDTSRLVNKKKTSTKTLVKRLLGRNERGVFHVAIHTKIEEIHQSKEKKVVESPEKANEDIVNKESNDVSNYLLLDSVEAASLLTFWREWNTIYSNLNTKHRLHMITLDVEFWSRLLAVTDVGWLFSSCLVHGKAAVERKVDDIPSRTQFAKWKIIFS
ncbi:unnamed protein product [Lactuca saligna]|uniref:Uncharacterized protein n=1 Tax=Lactuca saligna TaxID=75948 RepID=A0AA35YS12_LACSI|nr:unnamed protein product [Lactuca saligna]